MVVHHHPVNERPLKTPVSPWPPAVPLLEATLSAPIGMWIITTLRLMAALSAHVGPRISVVATSHAAADGCTPHAHWLRPCLSSWCKLARGPWTRPPQWLCPLRPLVRDCLTTFLWWQHHPCTQALGSTHIILMSTTAPVGAYRPRSRQQLRPWHLSSEWLASGFALHACWLAGLRHSPVDSPPPWRKLARDPPSCSR
jgi:hypothetical protein